MKVEEPDLAGSYTYADYLNWSWSEMTELIEGKIFKMSPSPSSQHQKIVIELSRQIANYLKGKKCQLFSAPFDVRLPAPGSKTTDQNDDRNITTVVQPDLCVVCDPRKIDERGCVGPPDWIIEILSPHTSRKDLREKFDIYEKSGVNEYWVVYPVEQTITVYLLNDSGRYQSQARPYIQKDLLSPHTLPDLVIDLNEVFLA